MHVNILICFQVLILSFAEQNITLTFKFLFMNLTFGMFLLGLINLSSIFTQLKWLCKMVFKALQSYILSKFWQKKQLSLLPIPWKSISAINLFLMTHNDERNISNMVFKVKGKVIN